MALSILLFVVSLAVLLKASDWFVESAETIGLSFGVSPFIIGITIVAFGTSLPELATSIASVNSGVSEIVIGNVIGSNITNILLVLGVTAFLGKGIKMDFDPMDTDIPLLFCSAFILYFMVSDFDFTLFEGILCLAALAIFLLNSLKSGKREEVTDKAGIKNWVLFVVGGILVYFGATYTIVAVKQICEYANIAPELISLSAIALGTSLPEVFVSLAAVRKGKHGIAIGNVLGSNIFNTYIVMGIPAFFGKLVIPEDIGFSLVFMVGCTIIFGIMSFSRRISRWEGGTLIVLYLFFLSELYKAL